MLHSTSLYDSLVTLQFPVHWHRLARSLSTHARTRIQRDQSCHLLFQNQKVSMRTETVSQWSLRKNSFPGKLNRSNELDRLLQIGMHEVTKSRIDNHTDKGNESGLEGTGKSFFRALSIEKTSRFTVWANGKQNSGLTNFFRESRLSFAQISSSLIPKNGPERLKLVSESVGKWKAP